MYVGNAFSLQMLSIPAPELSSGVTLLVRHCDAERAAEALRQGAVSCVGHPDTAALFTSLLGVPCPENRVSVTLLEGDTLFVGQVVGGRLPPGATTLPAGVEIRWLEVIVTSGQGGWR